MRKTVVICTRMDLWRNELEPEQDTIYSILDADSAGVEMRSRDSIVVPAYNGV
jgi:hypothetical protein